MIPHAILARQPNRLPWSQTRLQHKQAIALGFAVKASSVCSYTYAFQSYLSFCKTTISQLTPHQTLSVYLLSICVHIFTQARSAATCWASAMHLKIHSWMCEPIAILV